MDCRFSAAFLTTQQLSDRSMQPKTLGPYRIGKRIGLGGMGEVFEAVNIETDQKAAVKVLSPALARGEGFRDRFEAEVDSLRKLRHPNIVRLYGFGEEDEVLFYAMELAEGRSLEDELDSGRRFQWREITQIAITLCKALKHAHDHGVIHRDLKPANVVITSDDEIKLLDFGIARLFGGNSLTSAGGVLGTADYMSPEQADGRPVTDRCDQYSLGCVMYALATGKPPFQSTSLPELLQLQRYAQPEPVRQAAHEIPEELEHIIMRLLEKEPEDRFPNTQVLSRHLAAMERGLSVVEEEGDFQVTQGDQPPPVLESPDALGETRALVPEHLLPAAAPSLLPELTQDQASSSDGNPEGGESESAPTTIFTTVDDEEDWKESHQSDSWIALVAQWAGLAIVLALVVGALWHMLKPASADQLYAKIQLSVEDGRSESLVRVASEIGQFLDRYPEDPRKEEIAGYQEGIELDRAERLLRARARRASRHEGLQPIQLLYVEAIRRADSSPEEAIASLRALIDLYDHDEELTEVQKQCLTLAQRQLDRLGKRVYRYAPSQLKAMQKRLARAEAIRKSDPERARKMWRAIISLCRNKPWAADIVTQAREALEESTQGVTAGDDSEE